MAERYAHLRDVVIAHQMQRLADPTGAAWQHTPPFITPPYTPWDLDGAAEGNFVAPYDPMLEFVDENCVADAGFLPQWTNGQSH